MRVLGNPTYLEVPVELASPETNPARPPRDGRNTFLSLLP
jgi:hypothetical protein